MKLRIKQPKTQKNYFVCKMSEFNPPIEHEANPQAQELGKFFYHLTGGQNYPAEMPFIVDIRENYSDMLRLNRLVIETAGQANFRKIKITRLSKQSVEAMPSESIVELNMQNGKWRFIGNPSAGNLIFLSMYKDGELEHKDLQPTNPEQNI